MKYEYIAFQSKKITNLEFIEDFKDFKLRKNVNFSLKGI